MKNKQGKGLLKSKTFWWNIMLLIFWILQHTGVIDASSNIAMPVAAASNVVLRLLTKEPISKL